MSTDKSEDSSEDSDVRSGSGCAWAEGTEIGLTARAAAAVSATARTRTRVVRVMLVASQTEREMFQHGHKK